MRHSNGLYIHTRIFHKSSEFHGPSVGHKLLFPQNPHLTKQNSPKRKEACFKLPSRKQYILLLPRKFKTEKVSLSHSTGTNVTVSMVTYYIT